MNSQPLKPLNFTINSTLSLENSCEKDVFIDDIKLEMNVRAQRASGAASRRKEVGRTEAKVGELKAATAAI